MQTTGTQPGYDFSRHIHLPHHRQLVENMKKPKSKTKDIAVFDQKVGVAKNTIY